MMLTEGQDTNLHYTFPFQKCEEVNGCMTKQHFIRDAQALVQDSHAGNGTMPTDYLIHKLELRIGNTHFFR